MPTTKIIKELPGGITHLGTQGGSLQRYNDVNGNSYVRNEYGVGTPQYRVDYTMTSPDTPTPSSTPSATPSPFYDRYSPENMAKDIEAGKADIEKQKELNRIALIDAINSRYNAKRAGLEEIGAAEIARQRSMNLRSGTIDSPIGDTEIGKTTKANKATLDANEAARAEEITKTLMDLDEIAYNRKRDLTTDKMNEAKFGVDMRSAQFTEEQNKKTALKEKLAVLGKNNITLEQIKTKEPDLYNQMKSSGLSDLEIDSTLESSLPDEMKIKYQDITTSDAQGNAVLTRIGIDPRNPGKPIKKEYPLGVPYATIAGTKVDTVDGVAYQVITKSDGSLVYKPLTNKQVTPKDSEVIDQGISLIAGVLKKVTGGDGYVSPKDYKEAKQQWVLAGGKSADFDARLISFANPNDIKSYGIDKAAFGAVTGSGKSITTADGTVINF